MGTDVEEGQMEDMCEREKLKAAAWVEQKDLISSFDNSISCNPAEQSQFDNICSTDLGGHGHVANTLPHTLKQKLYRRKLIYVRELIGVEDYMSTSYHPPTYPFFQELGDGFWLSSRVVGH